MASKKVQEHLRKTPLNLSIPYITKIKFQDKCLELDVDKNEIARSLFEEFLSQCNEGLLKNVMNKTGIINKAKDLK